MSVPSLATAEEVAPATRPARPTLKMGDSVPAFTGKMVQGDSIGDWEKDTLYILEFWATWCLPCRAAIPHLNQLHEKYQDKGVVFIGQSVWEPKPEAVAPFMAKPEVKMNYRVAVDHKEGEPAGSKGVMARTWLAAAGVNGIPSTWMVRNGKVLWIGSPGDLNEAKIDAALNGTFDIINAQRELATKDAKRQQIAQMNQRFWDAMHDRDAAQLDAAIAEISTFYADKPQVGRQYRLRSLVALSRYSEALAMARESIAATPPGQEGFGLRLQPIQDLLITNPKDAAFLTEVQAMIDGVELPQERLETAKALTNKMSAWVAALRGDYATAVRLQEGVVSVMADSPLKPLEVLALDAYRAGKPPALMPLHSKNRGKKPATQPSATSH